MHHRRTTLLASSALLASLGLTGCSGSGPTDASSSGNLTTSSTATSPMSSAPRSSSQAGQVPAPPTATQSTSNALPVSRPTKVTIPAIGVQSTLIELGQNADGSIEVPSGAKIDHAGWYTGSPAPGQIGPAVILGHVESQRSGPSVFYKLGQLKSGDKVKVHSADGHDLTFTVYKVQHYPKDDFPTAEVYGNTPGPELRLITCSGDLNKAGTHHLDNTVVYAKLSG